MVFLVLGIMYVSDIKTLTDQEQSAFIIAQQDIPSIQPFYEQFKDQSWFQSAPEYPVYVALGKLFPNNNIGYITATRFFLIDQLDPFAHFLDPNLHWVELAYIFTTTNNLSILSNSIVQGMTDRMVI